MRACKILAICGCLFPVKFPLWRQWQPAGYTCLEDISYNRMPNSSYLTFMAILTASKIWLPMGTCEILLPVRYCYLQDFATCKKWLPARYCYLREMATCEILLPTRCGYLRDIAASEILAITGYRFPRISPIQRHCLRVRCDHQWGMHACKILAMTRCLSTVNLPLPQYWQRARYDCRWYMTTNDM